MTTAQHRGIFYKLKTDFAELVLERKNLEGIHRKFQSAFKNPYSGEMKNLNARWDDKIGDIRRAVKAAIRDGVRPKTVAGWLERERSWNAIRDIIRWDCEQG